MNFSETGPIEAVELLKILPHRYPFILIDRVMGVTTGKPVVLGMSEQEILNGRKGTVARAIKNVSLNEMTFMGHFPDNPVFPGVLTLEAMAQTGIFTVVPFLKALNGGALPELRVALASFDGVRFRKPVRPGDVLELTVTVEAVKGGIWSMSGVATVAGKPVAEGRFMAQLLEGEAQHG